MLRVLGVDPGLSTCGIGVVEGTAHGASVTRVGVVRTSADLPTGQRLAIIHDELRAVIASSRPDEVAVERVFFNANVRTAMQVGQAAGVALLCAAQARLPVTAYTPTQVKATITGSGDAGKQQVAFMVKALLRLPEAPRPADAADALALALCHLQRGASRSTGSGALSPRLAAALEAAGPGAQVVAPRGRA